MSLKNTQSVSTRGQGYVVKVAFIVDITGSMSRTITAVHELINKVIHASIHHFPGIQPEFGFVGYRDYTDSQPFVVIPFTQPDRIIDDFAAVIESDRCAATGGGDEAEDVLGGMQRALHELDWSGARVKIAIHVADAPHHGRKFCEADVGDSYPDREASPRSSNEILADFADQRIDYYFFQVEEHVGRLCTQKMARTFEQEYNACQSRTKNFTIFTFEKNFDLKVFFNRVMEGVSKSVLSFLKKDRTGTFSKPVCSKGELEATDASVAGILDDLSSISVSDLPVAEATSMHHSGASESKRSSFTTAVPSSTKPSASTAKLSSFTRPVSSSTSSSTRPTTSEGKKSSFTTPMPSSTSVSTSHKRSSFTDPTRK